MSAAAALASPRAPAQEAPPPATAPSKQQLPPGVAASAGIVKDNIFITDSTCELRTIAVSTTLPAAMQRANWRLEDFDLHKELYRGKTSLLYSATDRKSGVPVALKLYRKRKLSTLNKYQVEREIRIHVQLDHVHIIKLFAAFEDEKNVYMVQEFAAGGDLFEDLKRNGGTIKEKYVVRDIIVPFLNALQYLHGMGIIHRDIKPENILLGANRVIKIADFGLSICCTQERPVTRAGTLDYMAPEVLICPDKRRPEENKDKVLLAYTAQVDAWAVGILCYELLVGYPPFEQESRAATYEHIMYKEPKFPTWMTEDARKFIVAALCKNATQRPTITDLGKQDLILTYAKPVDKPLEARLPQEFLVERSARSVAGMVGLPPPHMLAKMDMQDSMGTSSISASATSTNTGLGLGTAAQQAQQAQQQQPHHLQGSPVVGVKRPGLLDTAVVAAGTDHDGLSQGSAESSPGPHGHLSPTKASNKVTNASSKRDVSGLQMDEDASYSITDFSTTPPPDDAAFFAIGSGSGATSPRELSVAGFPAHSTPSQSHAGGTANNTNTNNTNGPATPSPVAQPPLARVPSSSMRGAQSPLAKSRLSGLSQIGLSMPQGKVSPLARTSTLGMGPHPGGLMPSTSASSANLHGLIPTAATASGAPGSGQGSPQAGHFSPHPPSAVHSPTAASCTSDRDGGGGGGGGGGALVETSSGSSYYKPQSGILSDDSRLPRTHSMSGAGGPTSSSTSAAVSAAATAVALPTAARVAGLSSSGAGGSLRTGGLMERPNLEKLLAMPTTDEGSQGTTGDAEGSSKYGKLFAKMWGGGTGGAGGGKEAAAGGPSGTLRQPSMSASQLQLQFDVANGSFSSGGGAGPAALRLARGSSSSGVRRPGGAVRALQEDFLVERADSIIQVDRSTGSVIGAPTMNYKRPNPQALLARQAVEAAAAAEAQQPPSLAAHPSALVHMVVATQSASGAEPGGHHHHHGGGGAGAGGNLERLGKAAVARLMEDSGGPQRLNSEAMLARMGVGLGSGGGAAGGGSGGGGGGPAGAHHLLMAGRSFTSPNSPTMKKLANAPIVNKIQEYITQHAAAGKHDAPPPSSFEAQDDDGAFYDYEDDDE